MPPLPCYFNNFIHLFCILVIIQCDICFRSRIQWFITYMQHLGLITSALIPITHLAHLSPTFLHQPSVCSLSLRVFCGLFPFLLFFFPPFPYIHLSCFLNSTYEWNHMVFVFLWLISLSIIYSTIYIVANGKISFFLMDE